MSDIHKRIDTIIARLVYCADHFDALDMDTFQKIDDLSKVLMFANPPTLGVSVDEKIAMVEKVG